jgi:pimeloyl-ACP methyl ester carboxylesterase
MPDNFILDNITKVKVPVRIVQGRFDMVCPPDFAYKISRKLTDCRLIMTISNHKFTHENTGLFRAILDSL